MSIDVFLGGLATLIVAAALIVLLTRNTARQYPDETDQPHRSRRDG